MLYFTLVTIDVISVIDVFLVVSSRFTQCLKIICGLRHMFCLISPGDHDDELDLEREVLHFLTTP